MKNLYRLLVECEQELKALGIEYGHIDSIEPNSRAQSRWGQCRRISSPYGVRYKININQKLLQDNVEDIHVKETILHELLHTCEGGMSHTGVWKANADKVNKAYGYKIKREDSYKDKGLEAPVKNVVPKYILRCTKCGATINRQRMSDVVKHPEYYRCAKCHGKIERVK